MKVKIRRIDKSVDLPEYHTPGSAAFDIPINQDVTIPPKEIALISTGLFVQTPERHFLAIFSRSSTPKRKGLMFPHSVGILDPDYSGPEDEIKLLVYNFTDHPVEVQKGDRIAQGIFMPIDRVEWEEVTHLSEKSRGGFGSTGK
jgi:dUTP pyrophosphatase